MSSALKSVLFVALLLPPTPNLVAQQPEETDEDAERNKQLSEIYQQSAMDYRFTLTRSGDPLALVEKPVMQWLNVARVGSPRVQHGSVYVWTNNGRAEVVATIFSQTKQDRDPEFFHEMHSLSTGLLEARRDGDLYWQPSGPGIQRQAFAKAPPPAQSARLRMVQMRALVRRFSGYSINYDDARWDLRLLPEPLYRMSDSTDELVDGAVFALVSTAGTDPEVLIVIEAPMRGESAQWEWAVCRFTDLKTWVSLGGKQVWAFPNGSQGATTDAGPSDRYRFSVEGSRRLQ